MVIESNDTAQTSNEAIVSLADFGELVVRLSRLLGGLTTLQPLQSSSFGLTEWVALSLIAQGICKNNRQLARNLGVSRQRANQIKTSLERLDLIRAKQSETDARISLLSLTGKGDTEFKRVDSALLAALTEALKGRERALARANRSLKILTSLLISPKEAARVPFAGAGRARRARRAGVAGQAK